MSPWIVILTVAGYFVALLVISWLSARKSDNATFFTGNRRSHWMLVSFAMIGAAISGVTFISVPGMVAAKGYSYLQMALGFIIGYTVIAFVLVPIFYKHNLVSIYGYLDRRFGHNSYRSGAWLFFISKMLGASVRFFVVCAVLQALVCRPLGIPFVLNVTVTIALIWLYTFRGGVKTLIWTDALKSACLILSVTLCIYFVARNCAIDLSGIPAAISDHPSSKIWFFDDPKSSLYFWKQFLAGIFMAIATNGLDQDMMQRNMSCRDSVSSCKNMILSGIMQFFVITLFLLLGTFLLIYMNRMSIAMPEKSDEIFGLVAAHPSMPVIVGVLFIIGLTSSAYSATGSALTSLTTSFTIDILNGNGRYNEMTLASVRRKVHIGMAIIMALTIIVFYYLSSEDAISAVYTLASYTYGPILGLFVFGMFIHRQVCDKAVPAICIASPLLSYALQRMLREYFNYDTGFELLIINAAITVAGLMLFSQKSHSSKNV